MRVWKLMLLTLYRWPGHPQLALKRSRPRTSKLTVGHDWQKARGIWKCSTCPVEARSEEAKRTRQNEACKGARSLQQLREVERQGHKVKTMKLQGAPFIFCSACGGRGVVGELRAGKLLLASCPRAPPSKFAVTSIARMQKGRHPVTQEPFDGYAL